MTFEENKGMKLIILFTLLTSQIALAKVNVKNTYPILIPKASSNGWTQEDIGKVIPTDLQNSNDAGFVATRIGDHAFQAWFKSDAVKNSPVGRTAETVQETLKTEVAIKSDDKDAVEHKFSFQVLALQAISKIKYSGWLNAAVDYDGRSNEAKLEISEKLWNDKDFIISHTAKAEQGLSAVGLRWNW